MTLQEAIDKLNKIKETQRNSESLRIFMPDLLPLKRIRVVNLTRNQKFILVSDK